MKKGVQKQGASQRQGIQKTGAPIYAVGCFSGVFTNLQHILSTLRQEGDHANQGNAALDNLIKGLKMLHLQFEASQPFQKPDKESFHNAIAMFTQISIEHILNGWYIRIEHANRLAIFKGFEQKIVEILQLLEQIKNIASANKIYAATLKKFFSDAITHFRLFKAAFALNILNTMSHLLPQHPQSATELFTLLEAAKMEHSYLESRIPQMDEANKLFNGYEGFLEQNYFGMLNELTGCYVFDPVTRKLIDFNNPKKLLQAIKASKDDNSLFQRLSLCISMASRLNSLGSHQLAWGYLDFYFQHIERYRQIRKGTHLVALLASRTETVITALNTIYHKLVHEFKNEHDFSIDYSNFKIISAIIARNGRNEPTLNSTSFQKLKEEFQARRAQREADLNALLVRSQIVGADLQLTDMKARFVFNQKVSSKQLAHLLKQRGCKVKYKAQASILRTKNLHTYPLRDIEVFCNTYAELIKPTVPENIEALTEQFAVSTLSSECEAKRAMTGREYLKQNPPLAVKEKTKSVLSANAAPVEMKTVETGSRVLPEKVARLFGEQFKHKKVYRCHMKSGVDSYYVCLDEDEKNTNDCTALEREDFAKLFVDARQALNKKDFGFKISHIQATGEVSLCAKKGYLRAYPQTKLISQTDKSKILFLYNSIVKKNSKQEKHHIMETIQPAASIPNKKKNSKKPKHGKKKPK
ncbi:MAG: hypothetical protein JSR17_09970 [Proteobacteria bacterium]|nr:hypothetical protein [Pseudomonadota bacterium]